MRGGDMTKRDRIAAWRKLRDELKLRDSYPRGQSLEVLEKSVWPEPIFRSHLVTTCHRLRKKPVGCFTVEDLRIMIGQNIGLPYLMPIAFERLEEAPLAAGNFYPGDLLAAVLHVRPEFWEINPGAIPVLEAIPAGLNPIPGDLESDLAAFRRNCRQKIKHPHP
jgi:CDI immunity proteins